MSLSKNSNSKLTSSIDNSTTWGLDSNSLDNWLESDLKQSNLFQCRTSTYNNKHDTHINKNDNSSNNVTAMKCSLKNLLVHQPTTKVQEENKLSNDDKQLPPHLIPVIKVYSLLNTIRQYEHLAKEKQYNRKQLYTAPPRLPSPVLSTTSNHSSSNNDNNSMIPKRKKGNNHPSVDLVIKRQRNTDAARRSRLRKAMKMEALEKKVDVLKTNNERLRVKVAVLETEVVHASEKEQHNKQRVLELEAQLAVAHKQLLEKKQISYRT